MRIANFAPLALALSMAAAGVVAAVAPPASAAETKALSDTAYIQLARCAGIADGSGADTASYNRALDAADSGRESFVEDRANQARADAARETRRAGPDSKAHLAAERDGVCRGFVSNYAMN